MGYKIDTGINSAEFYNANGEVIPDLVRDPSMTNAEFIQYLVNNGLDLGLAMKTISNKLGGHGGGHKVAAGATISSNEEKTFLEETDKILLNQIGDKK